MKKKLLILTLFIATSLHAQEKMATTNGIISFEASVPFFENVEAKNETVNCYLNTKKGLVSFVVYVSMFHFQRSLMEDHFNANYLESKKYPKATFKGVIEKFEIKNIDSTETIYHINGKINIHGKSKNIRVPAKIRKVDKRIILQSNFTLNTDDFNIEIPYIVRTKISKKVNVSVYSVLQ
jgi:hypothetical protein